jgi:hypothetical protein
MTETAGGKSAGRFFRSYTICLDSAVLPPPRVQARCKFPDWLSLPRKLLWRPLASRVRWVARTAEIL